MRLSSVGFLLFLVVLAATELVAQQPGIPPDAQQSWSGYQRRAFDYKDDRRRQDWRKRNNNRWMSPQVNSGWFQRPYPYHLDYYKMRYHGSYEPYFGNLYGSPQVVTAPPYYGPYYGNQGQFGGSGYGNAYEGGQPSDVAGAVSGYPMSPQFQSSETIVPQSNPSGAAAPNSESLPAPK